jgi:adenylate cyclase
VNAIAHRIHFVWIGIFINMAVLFSQENRIDSLIHAVNSASNTDSSLISNYIEISDYYLRRNIDVAFEYADKALTLSNKLSKFPHLTAISYGRLGTISYLKRNYKDAINKYSQSLSINTQLKNERQMASNYNNLGLVYSALEDYGESIKFYLNALNINEKINNNSGIINNLGNIGVMYNNLNESGEAVKYFEKALILSSSINNDHFLINLYNNIGNSYTSLEDFEKALDYKLKALDLSQKTNDKNRTAGILANIGNIHIRNKEPESAKNYYLKALEIQKEMNDMRGIISTYSGFADVYFEQENFEDAKSYYYKSLESAQKLNDTRMELLIYTRLKDLYSVTNIRDSFYHYYFKQIDLEKNLDLRKKQNEIAAIHLKNEFSKVQDSLIREQIMIDNMLREQMLLAENQKKEIELRQAEYLIQKREGELQSLELIRKQTELDLEVKTRSEKEKQLELSRQEQELQETQLKLQKADINLKQAEIERQKSIRAYILALLGVLILVIFIVIRGLRFQKKANRIINKEKAKSEALLLNILPSDVANELKEHGNTKPRLYENTTVLFTDFVGFTSISEKMTPEELLQELNHCFTAFDSIVSKYHLEKIKTIGDAYMAVAGLNKALEEPTMDAINAAIEMRDFILERRNKNDSKFNIRIGLHSGKIIASIAGKVNISDTVYGRLKDQFSFEDRGLIAIKNKADMQMYFVERKESVL